MTDKRPYNQGEEARKHILRLRVSPDEEERVRQEAKRLQLTISQYIRLQCGLTPAPEE